MLGNPPNDGTGKIFPRRTAGLNTALILALLNEPPLTEIPVSLSRMLPEPDLIQQRQHNGRLIRPDKSAQIPLPGGHHIASLITREHLTALCDQLKVQILMHRVVGVRHKL